MIYSYCPRKKFTRIYVEVPEGVAPTAVDKDAVWAAIRVDHYGHDLGSDAYCPYDDAEEEAEERDPWFADWEDPRCWGLCGVIAVDSHY